MAFNFVELSRVTRLSTAKTPPSPLATKTHTLPLDTQRRLVQILHKSLMGIRAFWNSYLIKGNLLWLEQTGN